MKTKLHDYSPWEQFDDEIALETWKRKGYLDKDTVVFETNAINKVLLHNERQYFELVESLKDMFPNVESYESHFDMDVIEEGEPGWDENPPQVETSKYKPEHYPCLYVVLPMAVDDVRGFGGANGWLDDFVYLDDFEGNKRNEEVLQTAVLTKELPQ